MSNRRKARPARHRHRIIEVEGFDAEALDHAALDDLRWFDTHPGATSRARPAWPVEVQALRLDQSCPVVEHYAVRVHLVTRDSHAKLIGHAIDGRWEVVAVGRAVYPAGALDRLAAEWGATA